ncbi:MAG: adenosylcobinamide-GDP ribazoletransferase [Emcibacter sp.]|nr:adenosylcobinamide-GDP ribazoletransferase [Emcibacter sp.]
MTATTKHKSPALLRDIATALILLTRFPVPWHMLSDAPPNITKSLWAYPMVGFLVSAVGAAVYTGADLLFLPSSVAALLAITIMIMITGALHEDGLADMADGFGGGRDREHKLTIMRDSRIGTYGSLALLLSLGLRISPLATMTTNEVVTALLISGSLSRLMIVLSLKFLPSARQDGLAAETGKPANSRLLMAVILPFGLVFILLPWAVGLIIISLALVATWAVGRLSLKQIGGITGDVLGAIQQISEIFIFLGILSCGRMLS